MHKGERRYVRAGGYQGIMDCLQVSSTRLPPHGLTVYTLSFVLLSEGLFVN